MRTEGDSGSLGVHRCEQMAESLKNIINLRFKNTLDPLVISSTTIPYVYWYGYEFTPTRTTIFRATFGGNVKTIHTMTWSVDFVDQDGELTNLGEALYFVDAIQLAINRYISNAVDHDLYWEAMAEFEKDWRKEFKDPDTQPGKRFGEPANNER